MRPDVRKMLSFITTLLVLLLLWNIFIFLQQPGMVYYPTRQLDSTPDHWGLDYEDVVLKTEDGLDLHAWFIPNPSARKVLLFFHGNAGNMSHRRESVEIFNRLKLNVFIIDYRGYGKSQGRPGEQGTYRDARAAWDYLVKVRNINPEDIILFGRSLGGSVATKLAMEKTPAGLIVESTFSSARDMADVVMPLLSHVVVLRFNYDTESSIRKVTCPVLVVHSKEDEIIPYRLGYKVYDAANQPKSHLVLRGGHNDGFYVSGKDYTEGLKRYLDSHGLR